MFLPQYIYTLLGPPLARFAKLHVEMPEHAREDAAYLRVRQTRTDCISSTHGGDMIGNISLRLSDTIPRTDRECLECRSLVISVERIAEPAFWYEFVRVAEIVLGSIGGPTVDSYYGLK